MTTRPELPPLPNESTYIQAVSRFDTEFSAHGGVKTYLERYSRAAERSSRYAHFVATTALLATLLEPMDRSTGEYVDEARSTTSAFRQGSVAGFIMAGELHGSVMPATKIYDGFALPDPAAFEDKYEFRHSIAQQVTAMGWQGVKLIGGGAEAVVESWEEKVIRDVRYQDKFRVGFGFVALRASELHQAAIEDARAAALAEFETSLAGIHDFNWDEAAADLFGDSPDH